MAPKSSIEVRSESWLNLTNEQIDRKGGDKNYSQKSSISRHSLGSWQLKDSTAISQSSLSSSNKNEHLLIRLRQQSYLNRSSNSLSSNLSNSIDLSPSLVGLQFEQSTNYYDKPFDEQEEVNSRYQLVNSNLKQRSRFAEPPLSKNCVLKEEPRKLKHFRDKLQNNKRRFYNNCRDLSNNQRESESPLMRSLSSFSEKLNGKFTNFRHSWKHFLYSYNQQHSNSNHFERPPNKEEEERINFLRRTMNLSKFQTEKELPNRNNIANNRYSEFINRRQLTDDWLERYHRQDENPTLSGAEMRPKSLETLQLEELSTKFNHRQQKEKQDFERRNVFSVNIIAHDDERNHIDTNHLNNKSSESLSNRHTRDTPSSTTLVTALTSNNDSCPSTTCLESLGSNSNLNSNNDNNQENNIKKQMKMNSNNLKGAYNLSAKQIQGNNRADLVLPTSDYWSTVASNDYYKQQQQVGMGNIPLINTTQPMLVATDQEYYLDVASAAVSSGNSPFLDISQQQHTIQQMPTALLNNNHLPVSPPFINLTTTPTTTPTRPINLHPTNHQAQLLNLPSAIDEDYDDYAVPTDDSCRLDRSQVELIQMIGEGQKGYVFLGKLQSKDGHSIQDVAIKTLKYETEELIDKLMREAAMMRQFEHPHIIKFIGVCPETPALIAMELAEFGEIKQYLKLNKHLIQVSQLILFTFQISTALSYLESKQYVHRDVAARNVLVCSHNCVKLADFGLSRNLSPSTVTSQQQPNKWLNNSTQSNKPQPIVDDLSDKNHYVAASKGKLPVRWLAPESLAFRRFTSASDVWMFAVCSWELFHYGQLRPWAQIRNNQVLMAIESGQRLAKPPNCPIRLYQLMLQCWSYAPVQRPKFRELKQSLWSIYLNERAREQLEIEQQELQELKERKQNQERLMLLMNKQQSNRVLAEQRLMEQQGNFQDLGSQNQQPVQLQQQYQQQRINSMSPTSAITTSYTTGNASGYSSTTATTAEHSNNSSRSSSMGSLARNKAKLAKLSQQRQPQSPAMLASSSNNNNYFQLKMTNFNQVEPAISSPPPPPPPPPPATIISDQQQHVYLASEAQRLSAIKEKDERHKKVVGANMRRFQRMPGYVLQKQRSQGSIISDNLNDNIKINDNFLAQSKSSNNNGRHHRQNHRSGFDDCALLASSARSRQNKRQLISDLQMRVANEDDDDDADADADEDSSSETDTTTAVNVRKVVNNMERMSLASQIRTPEPAYEGLQQQVLMNRQRQQQQQQPLIEPRPESCTVLNTRVGVDNMNWPLQENINNSRQVLTKQQQQHIKSDQSQGKRLKERSSEPRLNDILQSLKISPMKAKLTYNRQGSVVEVSNRGIDSEILVGKRRLQQHQEPKSIANQMEENIANRQLPEEEIQRQQEQRQLALHQRLLGHIRPASSSKSSGRRSANLSNHQINGVQSTNEVSRDQQQPAIKVETVDQSLQILESLITDESSSKSAARKSVVSPLMSSSPSLISGHQVSKQRIQRGDKNGLLMEENSKGNKNNRHKQQQQQQQQLGSTDNMATPHARLLGLVTPPPGSFLPHT